MKEDRSVLAFFDDYAFGSHFTEFLTGQDHVGFAGQLLGFGIIDYEQAYFLDQSKQGFALDIDPKVDGVRQNEGVAFQLVEHVHLQGGMDIPEQHVFGV